MNTLIGVGQSFGVQAILFRDWSCARPCSCTGSHGGTYCVVHIFDDQQEVMELEVLV